MELNEALLNRRSIRNFKPEGVSAKIIEEIISAGISAPSASNRQLCEFVVVDDKKIIERIYKEAGAQKIILNAPALIAALYDTRFNAEHHANIQSASAAVENMLLKIHELGMGGCWIASFGDERILCKILNIPGHLKVLSIVILGKPADIPSPPPRKAVKDIVHFNTYYCKGQSSLPLTIHPRRCSWDEIKRHQQSLSRSSYLGKDYEIYGDVEIDKISGIIKENMPKTEAAVLSLFGYDGTLLRKLTSSFSGKKLIDLELSKEACDFVRHKIDFPNFIVFDRKIPLSSESVDLILCLFSLEKLPALKEVLEESHRVLRSSGKIIIFLKNKYSLYGLIYCFLERVLGIKDMESFFLSSSPFEPLSPAGIKKVMKDSKFTVQSVGFYLLPAELEIYLERADGYLKRHGRKLSIFKFFVKPCLMFLTFTVRLTSRINPPPISSTVCLIGRKERASKL